jgi:hypothetical protein
MAVYDQNGTPKEERQTDGIPHQTAWYGEAPKRT